MFHFFHRLKGGTQTYGQFDQSDIAQIVRRQNGKQEQANVGWGGVVGNIAARRFLKMIRWQPVVVRAGELLKKCPGASRKTLQLFALSLRQWRSYRWVDGGLANPVSNLGCEDPGDQ